MSKRLKLLVDAHVFDSEFQGSRTFIEELYKSALELYSDKIDFHFAAHSDFELKKSFGSDFNFVPLNSKNKFMRLGLEFPKIIKDKGFDWAHFQYIAPPIRKCRYLVTCHDILFESFPEFFPVGYRLTKHLMFKYSAKKADILSTVSEYSRKDISTIYNIPEKDIILTKNAVRKIEKNTISLSDKGKNILYLSRIEPRKNHHLLLEVFLESGLMEKGYKLIMVGKESIKNHKLDKLLIGLKSDQKKSIQFIPSVREEEKWDLIDRSCLFVYPSLAEGFGIPPLEAGLRKTSVICSNLTAMKEFNFFKPFHIDSSEKEILAKSLENALADTNQLRLDKISNQISSEYSWNKSAEALCEAIINKSKGG